VSGLVPEASTLYSRISNTVRNSQPKSGGQDDGAFAALMDSQADPAPAPKPSHKADKPAARDCNASDPVEPAAETATMDRAERTDPVAPEAEVEAKTDGVTDTETTVKVGQDFMEAIPMAEMAPPADSISTDPAAVVASAAVVDPNAAAAAIVAAPAVTTPVAAAPAGETEMPEATGEKLTGTANAAPALPAAAENAAPAQKTDGERAPQVMAPAQNSENVPADIAPEAAIDEAKDATAKSAKPAAPQDQAEAKAPPDAAAPAKPQGRRAADLDAAQPAVRPASEAAPQALTPAHSIVHAAAANAAQPQAAPVSAAQPVPLNALAVEIAGQARAGNSRFEIRLDPAELGRIDVRLDVDRDGNVTSRLVIERADTYDLLRRDQSTLERALQQAGLKTSDNSLEFSLRDQGYAQQRNEDSSSRSTKAMIAESDIGPTEAASGYARLLNARGGIDIRV
jgi:chemotaxis protein MotD